MDKYVLVTGGAGGIGLAVTERLAQSGYRVFCADLKTYAGRYPIITATGDGQPDGSAMPAATAVAKGGAVLDGGGVIPLIVDVTKNASVTEAVAVIKQYTDALLAVVNNAGIFIMDSVAEIDEEAFRKILDVNLLGMFRVNKACMPLLKGGYSRVINISSEVAQYSSPPFNGPYVISKYAVEAYSDALRRELSLLGIPVVKIRPGALKTDMIAATQKNFDALIKNTQYFSASLGAMNEMMAHELNKTNSPDLLAKLVQKIIEAKKPKTVYRIVNSKKLKFMGMLPEGWQDKLYKAVVGGKKK